MKTIAAAILLTASAALLGPGAAQAASYVASVYASGLNNPRGLAFSPDGTLYITESGTVQTGGPSTVVMRGGGPVTFHLSDTGSVTTVKDGVQQRIITGLASIGAPGVPETTGPQDIVFGADGTGYLLTGFVTNPAVRFTDLAPGGAGLGMLYSLSGNSLTPLADIAGLEATNPAGRELNANPFRIAITSSGLLVSDAGSNTLIGVGFDGSTANLATFFARDMGAGFPSDVVPTGVAVGPDGNYYVAELTGFPFIQGAAGINRVSPSGVVTQGVFGGFTNIVDIAFGADGSLYVLEFDSNGITTGGPGGALIQIRPDGTRETIYNTGLIAPTGLEIGRDGAFYVTNFSAAEGIGQVLRISAVPEPATWAAMVIGFGVIGAGMRRRKQGPAPRFAGAIA